MVTTYSNDYRIFCETINIRDKDILYIEDKEDDSTPFESVRKVHEVNNHKGCDQLVSAYLRAGWMSPEISNVIKRAVKNCKVG